MAESVQIVDKQPASVVELQPEIDAQLSAATLIAVFNVIRDRFSLADNPVIWSKKIGDMTVDLAFDYKFHLKNGSLSIRDNPTGGEIYVDRLNIIWDKLAIDFDVYMPKICTPLITIPTPWGDIDIKSACLFEDNPRVRIPIDLAFPLTPIVRETRISAAFSTSTRYEQNRAYGMSIIDAENQNKSNYWDLLLVPILTDIEPIDIGNEFGDLLGWLEAGLINWFKSVIPDDGFRSIVIWLFEQTFVPIKAFFRWAFNLPDDLITWLSNQLQTPLAPLDRVLLKTELIKHFDANPLTRLEDPYPILGASPDPNIPGQKLIPVKITLANVTLDVRAQQQVVELSANIGV